METTLYHVPKRRIHLAIDGTLISIVGLTIRSNDLLAGPNFVEHGFTRYAVLNTETRKWPVGALVESCTRRSENKPGAYFRLHGLSRMKLIKII
jgi:hypothetical protein